MGEHQRSLLLLEEGLRLVAKGGFDFFGERAMDLARNLITEGRQRSSHQKEGSREGKGCRWWRLRGGGGLAARVTSIT